LLAKSESDLSKTSLHRHGNQQVVGCSALSAMLPTLGMPLAFNICGNGFQNHCEKLETADSETKQYGVGKTG
jgi:hypothetical protein